LKLAWQALNAAPGTTTVLNAANEVAVAAFLDKRIRFDQIHHLNMATMEKVLPTSITGLEDLLALDHRSRVDAEQLLLELR
jgi:1-deoxy-D-xylulose-5-phosphate reductoisomerase